ncbi:MAG: anthranilate phosphoribosyltransferase [Verrucomicrobiota bacterium]
MKDLLHLTERAATTELVAEEIAAAATALLAETEAEDAKAAFLKALSQRGETPREIAAFVKQFLRVAVDPGIQAGELSGPMVDVCGTGGDKLEMFNVSTTVSFVLAGAGARVVKHGNRAITSKSGGADVLEALGVDLMISPERLRECLQQTGFGFLFAPLYHPAFKSVAAVRKRLASEGVRTIFNLLGPLLNPCRPPHQLIGVFSSGLVPVFAEILRELDRVSALVVYGKTGDGRGMDEISVLDVTEAAELRKGEILRFGMDLQGFEIGLCDLAELAGGDAEANAGTLTGILDGSIGGGKRDMVRVNAAGALLACGLAPTLEEGLEKASASMDSGKALAALHAVQRFFGARA